MGSRRLPSPGFERRSEFDLSPQVGRGEGTRDCYRPTISGTLARGRDVASALGADDAVDDGHAGNHECSHHIAISAARWPITSGCRISHRTSSAPLRQTGAPGELWALKSPSAYWSGKGSAKVR